MNRILYIVLGSTTLVFATIIYPPPFLYLAVEAKSRTIHLRHKGRFTIIRFSTEH